MKTSFFVLNKKPFILKKTFSIFLFVLFVAILLNNIFLPFKNMLTNASINENPFNLFGIFHKKQQYFEEQKAYIGGDVYCFELKCEGAIVKQFEDVKTKNGFEKPLAKSGVKVGDVITKINGESFDGVLDLISKIEQSDGSVSLEILSGEKKKNVNIFPSVNISGKKKIGAWIKDDISATTDLYQHYA